MARHLPESSAPLDEPRDRSDQSGHGGPDSGGQSGDTQGLSQAADATDASVEELADAGQDYEAGVQEGIENAADHPERPVPTHDGQERREDASPGRGPA